MFKSFLNAHFDSDSYILQESRVPSALLISTLNQSIKRTVTGIAEKLVRNEEDVNRC